MTDEIVPCKNGGEEIHMTKSELIAKIAEKAQLTDKQAKDAVDAIQVEITEALKGGEKISLPGFGTFEVRERAARQSRNPRTGETVEVAAKCVPAFKPGKGLKEVVDKAASN
jgi:DNA-binding protein HU-beta